MLTKLLDNLVQPFGDPYVGEFSTHGQKQRLISLGNFIWAFTHLLQSARHFFMPFSSILMLTICTQLIAWSTYVLTRTSYRASSCILLFLLTSCHPYLESTMYVLHSYNDAASCLTWVVFPFLFIFFITNKMALLLVYFIHAGALSLFRYADVMDRMQFCFIVSTCGFLVVFHMVYEEMLNASEKVKARFTSNISHELRTPLNGVLSTLEMLIESDLLPQQRDLVSVALVCGENMLHLVDELLEFYTLQSSKLVLEKRSMDVRQVFIDTVSAFARQASTIDIRLSLSCSHDVPKYITADPIRLAQVTSNLLSNAIKFSRPGCEVQIRVTVDSQDSKSMMRVEVTDEGVGISEEDLPYLFKPFSQLTETTAGTGIGLVICKSVVNRFGGEVGVNSVLGSGSCFWFTVPIENPSESSPRNKSEVLDLFSDESPRGSPLSTAAIPGTPRDMIFKLPLQNNLISTVNTQLWMQALGVRNWTWVDCVSRQISKQSSSDSCSATTPYADTKHRRKSSSCASALDLVGDYSTESTTSPQSSNSILTGSNSQSDLSCAPVLEECSQDQNPEINDFCDITVREIPLRDSKVPPLTLPAAAAVCESTCESMLPTVTGDSVFEIGAQRKILMAEDNPFNQFVLSLMLQSMRFEVVIANNGEECFNLYTEDPTAYCIILMDCQMPVMSGYEATEAIRSWEKKHQYPRISIVAVTADAADTNVDKCKSFGMDEVVTKPVRKQDIFAALSVHTRLPASLSIGQDD